MYVCDTYVCKLTFTRPYRAQVLCKRLGVQSIVGEDDDSVRVYHDSVRVYDMRALRQPMLLATCLLEQVREIGSV